uniref:Uncharacterized protein n=1 Tax=Amphimedon queenslandica TaxID=400682 RepID=A0A1X7VH25_AMPQE
LYITLGIFHRLFNLLEDECHMLDCSIAEHCDASSSLSSYLHCKTTIAALEQETFYYNQKSIKHKRH